MAKGLGWKSWIACGALLCLVPLHAGQGKQKSHVQEAWKEFQLQDGKCSVRFPSRPEHIAEKMVLPEEGYDLKYDAYISNLGRQAVFMLLVAEYPAFVDEKYAHASLEGFLNGILNHNPQNQLVSADLTMFDGHEALDFFIRNGGVYFKGRAMMIKNYLYLMAMESEVQNYNEAHFTAFIDSFQLTKD